MKPVLVRVYDEGVTHVEGIVWYGTPHNVTTWRKSLGVVPVDLDSDLVEDMEFAIQKAEYLLLNDENQDEPISGLDRLQRLRVAFGLDHIGQDPQPVETPEVEVDPDALAEL